MFESGNSVVSQSSVFSNSGYFADQSAANSLLVETESKSFKETLKSTFQNINNLTNQLASDSDTIEIDGVKVDKNSASASFLITKKLNDYEQVSTSLMEILNKYKEWDKTMGQSLSR